PRPGRPRTRRAGRRDPARAIGEAAHHQEGAGRVTPDEEPSENGNGGEDGSDPAPTRTGRWLLALVLLCLVVFAATVHLARQRQVLDTSDEAGYAEQADALLAGRGLTVGFVQFHHVKGSPDIEHPEDLYPPGMGAVTAVAYRFLGRSEFAAAVPSAILQCLVVPLLAFALALRLGARGAFAFAGGAAT